MKDKRDNDKRYFTFQEQEDEYAFQNYGVKIKNRAGSKKPAKFSERKEKDLLPI